MNPMKIITVAKMRYLEKAANEGGLSFATMMENAGRGTAEAIATAIRQKRPIAGAQVLVLVGPGNNGGDGLVAAHYLAEMGAQVTCYFWRRNVDDDPNYDRARDDGLSMVRTEEDPGYKILRGLVDSADIIIDALLGIGITRPIGRTLGVLLGIVWGSVFVRSSDQTLTWPKPQLQSKSSALVVAVDCPTGLDCDTGTIDPAVLPAHLTVTYGYPKVGMFRFPGANVVGEVVVVDIGIPIELAHDVRTDLALAELVSMWLPSRPASAHKGSFGRALVVAGSANYVGAASLAGAGALRVGAGLVTLGLPLPIQPAVAASLREATYLLLPHDMGVITSGAVDVLTEHLGDYRAMLLGPGLTQEKETVAFVHALLGVDKSERKTRLGFVSTSAGVDSQRPVLPSLVVDADGLNALAQAEAWWQALPPRTILTPHPGEMARLMGDGTTASDVQADREGIASRMADKWDAVVVLKGAFTVVATPNGPVYVLPFANPGLATAGSGDVLAGAIVGLLAQGVPPYFAAVSGAFVHAVAGEMARNDLGDTGMIAGDLLPRLPLAIRRTRNLT